MVPWMLSMLVSAPCTENNTDFVVWGTGKPLRQFIFALDLARLMIWCVRSCFHRRLLLGSH